MVVEKSHLMSINELIIIVPTVRFGSQNKSNKNVALDCFNSDKQLALDFLILFF